MSEHYFSRNDEHRALDRRSLRNVDVRVRGRHLTLQTSDSVFSSDGLDVGTEQLLRKAPPLPRTGTFLDLGCGWGVVSAFMAVESPKAQVWAVDVNQRALALTALNAQTLGADNIVVKDADAALRTARRDNLHFDVIWTNPPIRIGKSAMRGMLSDWLSLLSRDGSAYLVVNRHLGADSLGRWLEENGFSVHRIGSRKGFRVLEVHHAPKL